MFNKKKKKERKEVDSVTAVQNTKHILSMSLLNFDPLDCLSSSYVDSSAFWSVLQDTVWLCLGKKNHLI